MQKKGNRRFCLENSFCLSRASLDLLHCCSYNLPCIIYRVFVPMTFWPQPGLKRVHIKSIPLTLITGQHWLPRNATATVSVSLRTIELESDNLLVKSLLLAIAQKTQHFRLNLPSGGCFCKKLSTLVPSQTPREWNCREMARPGRSVSQNNHAETAPRTTTAPK